MTATEPTVDPATPADPATDPAAQPAETDWKAAAEKATAESRKHEARAKANAAAAKELETLKASQMTELERAVATAKAEARAEVLLESSRKVVGAEIRAAAAGRAIDVAALLEHVDTAAFATPEGEADTAAIGKWLDRIAPAAPPADPGSRLLDLGQGVRSTQPVSGSDPATQFGQFLQTQLAKR